MGEMAQTQGFCAARRCDMAEWKTIKNVEKIQPEGFEECGVPKAAYYVIHYEDGTTEEADFIAEHDDEGDEDYVPQTEEEILEDFREAVRELKLSLEGKIKLMPLREALANWDSINVDG